MKKKIMFFCCILFLILLCSKIIYNPKSLTTNTCSNEFKNLTEKIEFISQYDDVPDNVVDVEFDIFYKDNSGGMIPGPSDWQIKCLYEVSSMDIEAIIESYSNIEADLINMEWWSELDLVKFGVKDEIADYYLVDGISKNLILIFEDEKIIMKIKSSFTMIN